MPLMIGRCLLALAGLGFAGTASATTISWQRGPNAGKCADQAAIVAEVEARLGRALTAGADGRRLQVLVDQGPGSWQARIEMRDSADQLLGKRVISVAGEECSELSGYAALALALMIDPDATLSLEAPAAPSEPEAEAAAAPSSVEFAPEAGQPDDVVRAEPTAARVSGSGSGVVYVYAGLTPVGADKLWSRGISKRYVGTLIQRLLGAGLVKREVLTVVEPGERFSNRGDAESFLRRSERRPPPAVLTADGTPAPLARYLLLPSVDELLIQDGVDYSSGSTGKVVAVTVKLSARLVDVAQGAAMAPVEVESRFTVAGSRDDAVTRGFAARVGLLHAASDLLQALRRHRPFRLRPRFVDQPEAHAELASMHGVAAGDRFMFEDDQGNRSGYVTVHEVSKTHAAVRVWKQGEGTRLVETASAPGLSGDVSARWVRRAAYGDSEALDRQRALESGKRTRKFGGAAEIGLGWRFLREPEGGTAWRPLLDVHWTFAAASSLALDIGAQGGIGYEMALLPAIGLGLLPYVAGGGSLLRGSLGEEQGSDARLENALSATLSAGARFELYRLLGSFSLTCAVEAQYWLPLVSSTPRSDFVDDRYPDLHALVFQLGGGFRGSDYPD